MPTVPRYSTQVGRSGLPGARVQADVPSEAFRPAQPVDLRGVQAGITKIVEEEREKANQIASVNARAALGKFTNELIYHPETGIINRKGQNAFGAPEEVREAWERKVGEITQGLGNETQRAEFTRYALEQGIEVERAVHRHVAGEIQAFDAETTEQYLAIERDAAVLQYDDPERVQLSIDRQIAAIKDHARRNGLPSEWTEAKVAETRSKTHASVLARILADGNDLDASEYYKKHKDEMTGADQTAAERDLQEGSLRGESQRQAARVIEQASNRQEAADIARATIKDPKVLDEVIRRIDDHFSRVRTAQREQQEDFYLQATNILDNNTGVPAREIIPISIWSRLSLEQRRALENRGRDVTNDDRRWLDFLELSPDAIRNLSRAQFETRYWSRFDQSHRSRAETMWLEAREGSGREGDPTQRLTPALTFKDRVDNTIRSSGFVTKGATPATMSRADMEVYVAFETEAARRLEEYELTELQGKRRATGTEQQEILDKLVMERVFVRRFGRDPERLSVMLSEDELGRAYIPIAAVPMNDRQEIENQLRSNGVRVTNDRIERVYAQYILNRPEAARAILTGEDRD